MGISPEERHLVIVGEIKQGQYPCARSIAQILSRRARARGIERGVGWRTIQRDIRFLCEKLDAPIEYDEHRHGYFLTNPAWVYPTDNLGADELFSSLLAHALARPLFSGELLRALGEADSIQLATGDPDEMDPELFSSLVLATGNKPGISAEIFDTVIEAWRDARQLRLCYAAAARDGEVIERTVDVHALFLWDGAWYARVYCHLRRGIRNLALHRMRDPLVLRSRFHRDPAIIKSLSSVNTFGYEVVKNVRVRCSPEKARVIGERQWFSGQRITCLADGGLELFFSEAPRPTLLYWILSYAGHLTLLAPPEMRAAVHAAADKIEQSHRPEPSDHRTNE